jgi:putative membrane protein
VKQKNSVTLFISRLAKGFIIGASMLVPGVSGGTMAILLGVYDELISAVSSLRKSFRANCGLILQFAAGGAAGMVLLSGPVLAALETWTKPVLFFFMGAIVAGIPPIYRKVRVSRVKARNILVAALGAAIAVAARYLPAGLYTPDSGFSASGAAMLLAAGFIIAIALILPGISGSYVLLMLGMYDLTLSAFHHVELAYVVPLGIGILGGIFSAAKLIDRQMRQHPQFTYMLIIGFMIGSVAEVFPGMPDGREIVVCALTAAAGFGALRLADRWLGSA